MQHLSDGQTTDLQYSIYLPGVFPFLPIYITTQFVYMAVYKLGYVSLCKKLFSGMSSY